MIKIYINTIEIDTIHIKIDFSANTELTMTYKQQALSNFSTRSWLIGASLAMLSLMTGCQTPGGGVIPSKEFESFSPLSTEKRIMNLIKIKWEVREDVAKFCAKAAHMTPNQAYWSPPVACAVWNVPTKECTIVTGTKTNHAAIGHELRHCFEGHFH